MPQSLAILGSLLLLSYAYLGLSSFESHSARLLLFGPVFLIWISPQIVVLQAGREQRSKILDFFLKLAFFAMGYLSFFFLLCLVRDFCWLLLPGKWAELLRGTPSTAILMGLTLTMMAKAYYNAKKGPHIHEISVPIEGLDPALEGFKIAQISDLHLGPTVSALYLRSFVERLKAIPLDLIAFTGDLVDGKVGELSQSYSELKPLTAIAPCYFIPGNHEYYADGKAWIEESRKLGFRVLLNEGELLKTARGGEIHIGGVLDPAARLQNPTDRPDTAKAALVSGESKTPAPLKVLLAHNPKLCTEASASGFDLQLSGHTHGGQFHPWTLIAWLVHRPHHLGLSRKNRMWVYVHAGTGYWGPPFRLGTRTEIPIITLKSAP